MEKEGAQAWRMSSVLGFDSTEGSVFFLLSWDRMDDAPPFDLLTSDPHNTRA